MADVLAHPGFSWGTAARICPGEELSGDAAVVQPTAAGVLVAALDGAGHGEEAARAAGIARDILRASRDGDLPGILARSHEALRGTRGAAMGVAQVSVADCRLSWVGV